MNWFWKILCLKFIMSHEWVSTLISSSKNKKVHLPITYTQNKRKNKNVILTFVFFFSERQHSPFEGVNLTLAANDFLYAANKKTIIVREKLISKVLFYSQ